MAKRKYEDALSLKADKPFPYQGKFEWTDHFPTNDNPVPAFRKIKLPGELPMSRENMFMISIYAQSPIDPEKAQNPKELEKLREKWKWFEHNTFKIFDASEVGHMIADDEWMKESEYFGYIGWVAGVHAPVDPKVVRQAEREYAELKAKYDKLLATKDANSPEMQNLELLVKHAKNRKEMKSTLWVIEMQSDMMQKTNFLTTIDAYKKNWERQMNSWMLTFSRLNAAYERLKKEQERGLSSDYQLLKQRLGAEQEILGRKPPYSSEDAYDLQTQLAHAENAYVGFQKEYDELVSDIELETDDERLTQLTAKMDAVKAKMDVAKAEYIRLSGARSEPTVGSEEYDEYKRIVTDYTMMKKAYEKELKSGGNRFSPEMLDKAAVIKQTGEHIKANYLKFKKTDRGFSSFKMKHEGEPMISTFEDLEAKLERIEYFIEKYKTKAPKVFPELEKFRSKIVNYFDGWIEAFWNAAIYAGNQLGCERICVISSRRLKELWTWDNPEWSADNFTEEELFARVYDDRAFNKYGLLPAKPKMVKNAKGELEPFTYTWKDPMTDPAKAKEHVFVSQYSDYYALDLAKVKMKYESYLAMKQKLSTLCEEIPWSRNNSEPFGWKHVLFSMIDAGIDWAKENSGYDELSSFGKLEARKKAFRNILQFIPTDFYVDEDWRKEAEEFIDEKFDIDVSDEWRMYPEDVSMEFEDPAKQIEGPAPWTDIGGGYSDEDFEKLLDDLLKFGDENEEG